MSDKHPLDEYFKEGLNEHKMQPSQSVWDKIEAAAPAPEKSRKGGWYIMRAAVVVLLIGLSSVFYYQNHGVDENWAAAPDHTETKGPEKEKKTEDQQKSESGTSVEKKSESKEGGQEAKPKKKPVPIMRQSTGRQIYVSNEDALSPIDESSLMDESKPMLAAVDLKVEEATKPVPVKIKFKVKPKVTTQGFYANEDSSEPAESKKDFKDRLYAYASNQFDNIKNGKPVELPKPEKKPQIEIDLGKIF